MITNWNASNMPVYGLLEYKNIMAHDSRSDKVQFASYLCSHVRGGADIGEEKRFN